MTYSMDVTMLEKPMNGGAKPAPGDPSRLREELRAVLSTGSYVAVNEPMARRTTLRTGGNADLFLQPARESDLSAALKLLAGAGVPVFILGRGSNLLIRDGGIRGAVIALDSAAFSGISVQGDRLICGAGARLKQVAVEARKLGLAGFEFLEGIPGSIGGALRMNAGAMGSWMFAVVEKIRHMDRAGVVHECTGVEAGAEYRHCPLFETNIALSAVLKGQPDDPEEIGARMYAYSRKRWASQPAQPSAGCIFKNPESIPAGKLIQDLGLKGCRVGGAVVSQEHGNFIVNDRNATASEILELIEKIRARVRSERGIELQTEVEIVGEDAL